VHFRERACAALTDRLVVGAEPGGVLLGADDADAELARRIGQPCRFGDSLRGAVDRRHQPGLVIDQHQHAAAGVHRGIRHQGNVAGGGPAAGG